MVLFISIFLVTTLIKRCKGLKKFLYNKFFLFMDFKRQVDNQGFLSAHLDALIFLMGKQELKISEYVLIEKTGIGCIYIGIVVDI